MKIYIGADHRGFELKESLKKWLSDEGYEVEDVGNHQLDPDDDYIDPAIKVAEFVTGGDQETKGVLICGSGHGVLMVANRFPEVRAALAYNREVAVQMREHEDANVIVIPADWVKEKSALQYLQVFLTAEKSSEMRHERRRARLANIKVRRVVRDNADLT